MLINTSRADWRNFFWRRGEPRRGCTAINRADRFWKRRGCCICLNLHLTEATWAYYTILFYGHEDISLIINFFSMRLGYTSKRGERWPNGSRIMSSSHPASKGLQISGTWIRWAINVFHTAWNNNLDQFQSLLIMISIGFYDPKNIKKEYNLKMWI